MIVNVNLNPKSPYNSACPNIIQCQNIITHKFIEISLHLWIQLSGHCLLEEFTTKHQSNVSEKHSTPLIVFVLVN